MQWRLARNASSLRCGWSAPTNPDGAAAPSTNGSGIPNHRHGSARRIRRNSLILKIPGRSTRSLGPQGVSALDVDQFRFHQINHVAVEFERR